MAANHWFLSLSHAHVLETSGCSPANQVKQLHGPRSAHHPFVTFSVLFFFFETLLCVCGILFAIFGIWVLMYFLFMFALKMFHVFGI
jgi:hypothetical protein